MPAGLPGSVEEDRDLLDGRAFRARAAPGAGRRGAGGRSGARRRAAASRRGRRAWPAPAPCASSRRARARGRRAGRCRRRPRSPARPRDPASASPVCLALATISVGARSSLPPEPGLCVLGGGLERLARGGADHPEAPRVGQVMVRRPARELEQLEQDIVGHGVRAERLVRAAGADELVDHPRDATRRRTASSAFASPWFWTPWPAPSTTISLPWGARLAVSWAHSIGVERSLVAGEQHGRDVRELGRRLAAAGTSDRRPVQALQRDPVAGRGRAVVRVEIRLAELRGGRLERRLARPSSGAEASPQGAGESAHSVLDVQALAEPRRGVALHHAPDALLTGSRERSGVARRRPARSRSARRCRAARRRRAGQHVEHLRAVVLRSDDLGQVLRRLLALAGAVQQRHSGLAGAAAEDHEHGRVTRPLGGHLQPEQRAAHTPSCPNGVCLRPPKPKPSLNGLPVQAGFSYRRS